MVDMTTTTHFEERILLLKDATKSFRKKNKLHRSRKCEKQNLKGGLWLVKIIL